MEKLLAKRSVSAYRNLPVAEVAQLVEHLVVAQVAVGSSPIFRPIHLPRVRLPRRGVFIRSVAQLGSAPALGAGGRQFESGCPDQHGSVAQLDRATAF